MKTAFSDMPSEFADPPSPGTVLERFPWADTTGQSMVIGADIDAILSAAYLADRLDWTPIGFYAGFDRLFTADGVTRDELVDAVWVDLDISHPEIASIGHHILAFDEGDAIEPHANSLNPNLLRGVTHESFSRKYPLGTLHLVTWLHGESPSPTATQKLLYWLPDSSWINAQSHRFRDNVRDWLFEWVPIESLTSSFEWTDTAYFEERVADELYPRIERTGFERGHGQVTSRHRGLDGYQCTFDDPTVVQEDLQSLVDLAAAVMGWDPFDIPDTLIETRGTRHWSYSYSTLRREYGDLDTFLDAEDVFSYAIPNWNTINYTTGIDLPAVGRER